MIGPNVNEHGKHTDPRGDPGFPHRPDLHAVMNKQPATTRQLVLEAATRIVTGERNQAYGNPEDNFKDIAFLWNWFINRLPKTADGNIDLQSYHVADMMILMKEARNLHKPGRDNYVDMAGYAACGAEAAHV